MIKTTGCDQYMYAIIYGNMVSEVHKNSTYPPDKNGRICVAMRQYSYEFFTLGIDIFYTHDEAVEARNAEHMRLMRKINNNNIQTT